ncbi:MAG: STAS domain-containing protein [Treponema sp.]|jgi:anti-sigma B factor antagonist|nr:STAS domain-containing protein [Treponema sp.]
MEIVKTREGDAITLSINGKLSAGTAEEFGAALNAATAETDKIILDFQGVSYLASAGLRVLVFAQKQLVSRSGSLSLINVNENVREVFEVTGLDDIFDI